MIIIVAPYSPIGLSSNPHLGAARKIEMVIEALSAIDSDILLVNSAHNEINQKEKIKKISVGSNNITHFTIPTYRKAKYGKFLNLKDVWNVVDKCLSLGKPDLIWIYNGYAFENLFSIVIKKKIKVPVILEFEDWHFSRSRGFNPKPYLDYLLWKFNLKNIDFSFGVNDNLVKIMSDFDVQSALLPGIVPVRLIELCDKIPPFDNKDIKLGYFGGLSREKGVDVLIDVIKQLPDGYRFIISGAGKLEKELEKLAAEAPTKLEFHGRVSEDILYELISSVDVLLNPHSSINEMGEGVFPFKVIEAIASGKLLFSTDLPSASVPGLLGGVVFYDGKANSLLSIIAESRALHEKLKEKIRSSSLIARERFSILALLVPIRKLMTRFGGIK
jgi:glycosyltransferase involved in cell wall biosynthesis